MFSAPSRRAPKARPRLPTSAFGGSAVTYLFHDVMRRVFTRPSDHHRGHRAETNPRPTAALGPPSPPLYTSHLVPAIPDARALRSLGIARALTAVTAPAFWSDAFDILHFSGFLSLLSSRSPSTFVDRISAYRVGCSLPVAPPCRVHDPSFPVLPSRLKISFYSALTHPALLYRWVSLALSSHLARCLHPQPNPLVESTAGRPPLVAPCLLAMFEIVATRWDRFDPAGRLLPVAFLPCAWLALEAPRPGFLILYVRFYSAPTLPF
ncbi:hypothetical protein K438DRAFT_1970136 [Mycena galopus ATCC 62051]|nr:hypothetical protein K438DRAFT_1970136 [Mycena galopus ATCC 62051]